MSVKSLTVVVGDDGKDVCVLLRTLDGHLTGHGVYLRDFLRGCLITRELIPADKRATVATIGRLAALLIANFRSGIGDFELLSSGTRGVGEEYIYLVSSHHMEPGTPSLLDLRVEVVTQQRSKNGSKGGPSHSVLYEGLLDEFDANAVETRWSRAYDERGEPEQSPRSLATAAGKHKST